MVNAYETAFKYEILNGVIAGIAALITRSFPKTLPGDIGRLDEELWEIYRSIQLTDDLEVFDRCGKRLAEIRGYIQEHINNAESGLDSDYSERDVEAATEWIFARLTVGKHPSSAPAVYLLGGQSGAGKSVIHRLLLARDPNFVVLDGDLFREFHPNFSKIQKLYGENAANYTQSFSNSVVNSLLDRLSGERFGLIIEGTCRTAEVPLNTCRLLKSKGYYAALAVICTDSGTSWESAAERYDAMKASGTAPRAVPREKYLETVRALPGTISELYTSGEFDDVLLFNRNAECLYRFKERSEQDPAEIVMHILHSTVKKG